MNDKTKESKYIDKFNKNTKWKKLAKEYIKDKSKIIKLIGKAQNKAIKNTKKPLGVFWNKFEILLKMLKDWVKGEYIISISKLIIIVGGIIYLVVPTDILPDIIPVLGFVDDVAILKYVIGQVDKEIKQYLEWKSTL